MEHPRPIPEGSITPVPPSIRDYITPSNNLFHIDSFLRDALQPIQRPVRHSEAGGTSVGVGAGTGISTNLSLPGLTRSEYTAGSISTQEERYQPRRPRYAYDPTVPSDDPEHSYLPGQSDSTPSVGLPCPFTTLLDCAENFRQDYIPEWVEHSLTHLYVTQRDKSQVRRVLCVPLKSECPFCPAVFSEAQAQDWTVRMHHVAYQHHIAEQRGMETARMDWGLVTHLWECELIDKRRYAELRGPSSLRRVARAVVASDDAEEHEEEGEERVVTTLNERRRRGGAT